MTYVHDRTDTIPLAADVARCEPSGTCHVRGTCARYQSAIPTHGARLQDFSIDTAGGTALCSGYVDSRSVFKAAQPARPAKPHIRGL